MGGNPKQGKKNHYDLKTTGIDWIVPPSNHRGGLRKRKKAEGKWGVRDNRMGRPEYSPRSSAAREYFGGVEIIEAESTVIVCGEPSLMPESGAADEKVNKGNKGARHR